MMHNSDHYQELLPHFFRQEYAKMTAVLCRHFGLQHMEVAEDIVSDTFLKASGHWALHGVPPNPEAWLYTVAKNKTKDYLKRLNVFNSRVKEEARQQESATEPGFEFNTQWIADGQLAMIFAVCDPAIPVESQIALALQVLCGFSVEEISRAFLSKYDTIRKRLQRARAALRESDFRIDLPDVSQMMARLPAVLKTLYLLFNEGYCSVTEQPIRKELCAEATRLTLMLADHPRFNLPEVNALLALLCYQSSRLDARIGDNGIPVLFEEQDRTRWDQALIDRGNYYLVAACAGNSASAYHLEAGIAYWHTTTDARKWQHILTLYEQLLVITYSPVTALNRLFAFAKVHGPAAAIAEAVQLHLPENNHYHALLGYLYTTVDPAAAKAHYASALALTKSAAEEAIIQKEMEKLV
jgi:RNA polymerase sigma-70 factor (ECF subfamily)